MSRVANFLCLTVRPVCRLTLKLGILSLCMGYLFGNNHLSNPLPMSMKIIRALPMVWGQLRTNRTSAINPMLPNSALHCRLTQRDINTRVYPFLGNMPTSEIYMFHVNFLYFGLTVIFSTACIFRCGM